MKKKRKNFESRFWSGSRKHSRIKLIETFFQFNDLVTAKQMLSNIMIYTGKKKKSVTEDSAALFHFHQALRSFIRACYSNALKENKSTVTTLTENCSPLMQGSLSDEEYLNPTLLFQRAFKEFSVKDFDYFIAVAVYF